MSVESALADKYETIDPKLVEKWRLDARAREQHTALARFREQYRDNWPEGHERHVAAYIVQFCEETEHNSGFTDVLCSCGELLCVERNEYTAVTASIRSRYVLRELETSVAALSRTQRNLKYSIAAAVTLTLLNIALIVSIATHTCH